MGFSKVKTLSVMSKPAEQLELVGEGKARETRLVLCHSRLG